LTLQPLEYAEIILFAIGGIIALTAVGRVLRRPDWRDIFRLPPAIPNSFSPVDLLLTLLVGMMVGSICLDVSRHLRDSTPPAGSPSAADAPDPIGKALAAVVPPGVVIPLLLVLGRVRVPGGWNAWGIRALTRRDDVYPGVIAYLAIWPVCAMTLWLTRRLVQTFSPGREFDEHSTLTLLRTIEGEPAWIGVFLIIGAVLAAPMLEELLFRGVLQNLLTRVATPVQAWVSTAVLFGLFHWSNPETIPPLIVFGLALGYAYARTGSLMLPIVMHVLFNAKTIAWLLLGAGK